jgi:hypothetical protein
MQNIIKSLKFYSFDLGVKFYTQISNIDAWVELKVRPCGRYRGRNGWSWRRSWSYCHWWTRGWPCVATPIYVAICWGDPIRWGVFWRWLSMFVACRGACRIVEASKEPIAEQSPSFMWARLGDEQRNNNDAATRQIIHHCH